MRRRALLAAIAAGSAGLAGCGARSTPGSADGTPTGTPPGTASVTPDDATAGAASERPDDGLAAAPVAADGYPPTVCSADPIEGFHIRAIGEPAFADGWADREVADRYRLDGGERLAGLERAATVVGVERNGRARAYPVTVLYHHEIVNDELGGPLLVTYCSLCRSGVVAERLVDGGPAVFDVSGQLWRPPGIDAAAAARDNRTFGATRRDTDAEVRAAGNLVMVDDATGSYWSQLLARAICGPRAGETLPIRPSTLTTWGEWRATHPGTGLLLPPPHSTLLP
jgi:hypothetical protein